MTRKLPYKDLKCQGSGVISIAFSISKSTKMVQYRTWYYGKRY